MTSNKDDLYSDELDVCACDEAVENERKYEEAFQREYGRLQEQAKRERIAKLFDKSKIPARWKTRTFEHFTVNASNEEAYKRAFQYAQNFDPTIGEGLLFIGTVGLGKTHLAAAIAMTLMEREHSVVFGTINTLLSEIRYSFNNDEKQTEKELFTQYTTCDLLIIDDLGKERVSDWTEGMVFDILNHRYDNCKSVIITTNLSFKEIRSKYEQVGEAMLDRIIEMCQGVKLQGESWRRRGLA